MDGVEPDNKVDLQEEETKLQHRKLELEIKELEKRWFLKPTYFVPLIAAASSIIILWRNGYFSAKSAELNAKRENLIADTRILDSVKQLLIRDTVRIHRKNQELLDSNQLFKEENRVLKDEKLQLSDSLTSLEQEIDQTRIELTTAQSKLEDIQSKEISLDELKFELTWEDKNPILMCEYFRIRSAKFDWSLDGLIGSHSEFFEINVNCDSIPENLSLSFDFSTELEQSTENTISYYHQRLNPFNSSNRIFLNGLLPYIQQAYRLKKVVYVHVSLFKFDDESSLGYCNKSKFLVFQVDK